MGASISRVTSLEREHSKKLGAYIFECPQAFKDAAKQAVLDAERVKGEPPFMVDIHREYVAKPENVNNGVLFTHFILMDLYRNDELLADRESNRYSLNESLQKTAKNSASQYELFSDRVHRSFPKHIVDEKSRLQPGPDEPVVDLAELRELLLSTDLARAGELDWADKGQRRFLNKKNFDGQRISFCSFPRTGNSMTRVALERIAGLYTGSDMSLIQTQYCQVNGMLGEQHVSDERTVWVTKTHWPVQSPFATLHDADRMFVITRNPIDVIPSFLHLTQTASQSVTIENVHTEHPEYWDQWVRYLVRKFKEFHTAVEEHVAKKLPIYWMRFEDQKINREESLTDLFRFILDVPSLEGTVVEQRIKACGQEGAEKGAFYTLKDKTGGKLLRNAHMYTPEQLDYVKTELKDFLYFFGYTNNPASAEEADNRTAFFDFGAEHAPEDAERYNKYLACNEEVIASIGQREGQEPYRIGSEELMDDFKDNPQIGTDIKLVEH